MPEQDVLQEIAVVGDKVIFKPDPNTAIVAEWVRDEIGWRSQITSIDLSKQVAQPKSENET